MKRLQVSIFTALVCLFASTSYAMPIVSPSGVTGLEVDGVLYDIAIGEMGGIRASEAFAGLELSSFDNLELVAVNNALAELLNTAGFTTSSFFDGCEVNRNERCKVFLPTRARVELFAGTFYHGAVFRSVNSGAEWQTGGGFNIWGIFPASQDDLTFGVVSRAAVPSPATIALFGVGLAGLGITRRKRITQV